MKRLVIYFALGSTLCGVPAVADAQAVDSAKEGFSPPRQVTPVRAWVPFDLLDASESARRVVLRLHIDQTGEVRDAVAISAGKLALVERAERLMLKTEFKPALQEGQPVEVMITCELNFTDASDIQTVSILEYTAALTTRSFQPELELQNVAPSDLDAPLRWDVPPTPVVAVDADDQTVYGEAVVHATVDHTGRLHLLHVAEASHPAVAQAALEAFSEARFLPPTHQGKPATVRVRLPFAISP